MDVRLSLNAGDYSVITGDGQMSFVDSDSFAKAPPQATSTVGRTKSRQFKQDAEMGSFLDDIPCRLIQSVNNGTTLKPFSTTMDAGALSKVSNLSETNNAPSTMDNGDLIPPVVNIEDWSAVNDWCRDNKQEVELLDQDGKSSLGIINVDEMDLSTSSIFMESLRDKSNKWTINTKETSSVDMQTSGNSHSTLKEQTSTDSNQYRHDGSSSSSQDSKPDHPFARTEFSTIKKNFMIPTYDATAVIRQALFGESPLRDTGEFHDILDEVGRRIEMTKLDDNFGEFDKSVGVNSDDEDTTNTPTNKVSALSDELQIDSVYLRPGTTGEDGTLNKLPYLSKVSLFDGGSGSEIDTEEELELVKQVHGTRVEAAGEASAKDESRPGLEGGCAEENNLRQNRLLPIAQRQSAEGDVFWSPVPGDGGCGGDGTSGSDTDSERSSIVAEPNERATPVYHTSVSQQSIFTGMASFNKQQEQRIRPMGDDLLSDLRFSTFGSSSAIDGDGHLHSRYLTPTNQHYSSTNDFLGSQNSNLADMGDFDPENRLEASGFNADDLSAVSQAKGSSQRTFDVKCFSFGSFGLDSSQQGTQGPTAEDKDPVFGVDLVNSLPCLRESNNSNQNGDDWHVNKHSLCKQVGTDNDLERAGHGEGGATSGNPLSGLQRTFVQSSSSNNSLSTLRTSPKTVNIPTSKSNLFSTQSLQTTTTKQKGTNLNTQDAKSNPTTSMTSMSNTGTIPTKLETSDTYLFRKPTMPVPKKAGALSKSMTSLSGTLLSQSCGGGSGKSSSTSSSIKFNHSEYVDLAYKMCLSEHVEEQKEGLKRVPSCGGTTELDLTINDADFFDNADALAMMDADEVKFEEEHVFRQDDAMATNDSPDDMWAYRSILTVARPSWMEDAGDEEQVLVRFSVGTYMRGRTEALGSLSGEKNIPRPYFGMDVDSPKKVRCPSRLLEDVDVDMLEGTRTSGVGEYDAGTSFSLNSCDVLDNTVIEDPVPGKTSPPDTTLSISTQDLGGFDNEIINKRMSNSDITRLSMSDISLMLKQPATSTVKAERFINMQNMKSKQGTLQSSITKPFSNLPVNISKEFPPKSSLQLQRPALALNQNFPKVSSPEKKFIKSEPKIKTSESKPQMPKETGNPLIETVICLSPGKLNQSLTHDDVWSSPNASTYTPGINGLFDRLDEFRFGFKDSSSSPKKNLDKMLVDDLLESSKVLCDSLEKANNNDGNYGHNRELTPPPDGEDKKVMLKTNNKLTDNLGSSSQHSKADSHPGQGLEQYSNGRAPRGSLLKNAMTYEYNSARLNISEMDHGCMPGHHVPDGTAYSQRSNYAKMDDKGEFREDVVGVDDVGLAESRGFNMLKKTETVNKCPNFVDNSEDRVNNTVTSDKHVTLAQQNKSRQPLNLQPVQNKNLLICASLQNQMSSALKQIDREAPTQDLKIEPVQSNLDSKMLESWTQTSVVLCESIGLQPDEDLPSCQVGGKSYKNTDSSVNQNCLDSETLNISSIPPKLPVTSFKHNLLPDECSVVAEKPHLLLKQSLLQTEFAKDNLKRDYDMEVMERIYSRNATGQINSFFELEPTNSHSFFNGLAGKEFIESHIDWQQLQGRETMDTVGGDFPRISDIYQGESTSYYTFQRQPFAQSTPYLHFGQYPQNISQTALTDAQNLSMGSLSVTDGNLTKQLKHFAVVPATPCHVEAPAVLKFKEPCCVGLSSKEVLTLKNPTDTWIECFIVVKDLLIDGRKSSLNNFPFEIKQKKIIIHSHETDEISVIFIPKFAGAYIAQVQVFSHSFVTKEDTNKSMFPVTVTFQATAEVPSIKVICNDKECDTLHFGEITWGSCHEKTVCIRNMGLAPVPLRLAITSNKSWNCFSFEPEVNCSDMSINSGCYKPSSELRIINISLAESGQPFSSHEVTVGCRPPDKQCTKVMARQPPEEFSGKLEIDVNVPCGKIPKLCSLPMTVVVGIKKLHIQSNLKEILLTVARKNVAEASVKVFNAGNLSLNVTFGFSDYKDILSVSPPSVTLQPGIATEIVTTLKPNDATPSRLNSLLLMWILPFGPMYELVIHGQVLDNYTRSMHLLCDCPNINFGGVSIGKTSVKCFKLLNKDSQPASINCQVQNEDIRLALSADPSIVGSKLLELCMQPMKAVSIYVLYCPSSVSTLRSKVTMRPISGGPRFTVKLAGYGGVSRLCCSDQSVEVISVKGYKCLGISFSRTENVKEMFVQNRGVRTASVKVYVFKDVGCCERMLSRQIVVRPSEFIIEADQQQKIEIYVDITEREFLDSMDVWGVGAVVCLSYVDKVDCENPHRSQLIVGLMKSLKSKSDTQLVTSTPSLSKRTVKLMGSASVDKQLLAMPNASMVYTQSMISISNNEIPCSFRDLHTDRSDSSMGVTYDKSMADNTGGWCLNPQQVILYCSSKDLIEESEKFYIQNNNNKDIRFELSWPGRMLSLTPDWGVVKARENKSIMIYTSTQVSQNLNQLPWSGAVTVTCGGLAKSLKVHIKRDMSPETSSIHEPYPASLVPITTNIPHSVMGSKKLANLEVSSTIVEFQPTSIGQTSEEFLELNNTGNDTISWIFSTFAAPYLRKKFESSKEVYRVSYKVFDFSQQHGTLNAQSSVKLSLQFMPRSDGMFSQYFDLQTSGSGNGSPSKDLIRIHLTGEGIDNTDVNINEKTSVTSKNLIPKQVAEICKLRIVPDILKFSPVALGGNATLKVKVNNSYAEDVQVALTAPKPPFFLKVLQFKAVTKTYVRFPVEFKPTQTGKYTDIVKLKGSSGENLSLQVIGECK